MPETIQSEWTFLQVPAEGWDLQTQSNIAYSLSPYHLNIVFVSPIPVLLGKLSGSAVHGEYCRMSGTPCSYDGIRVYVFHNDKREKKEVSDGKVISTVAAAGWQLVEILPDGCLQRI